MKPVDAVSTPLRGKQVLLVGPRYHTNYHGWVWALNANHCAVRFLAQYRGQTETYDLLTPFTPGTGPLFEWLTAVLPTRFTADRLLQRRIATPRVRKVIALFRSEPPDVVLVRFTGLLTLLTGVLARVFGAQIVLYDQTPVDHGDGNIRGWHRITLRALVLLARRDLQWISPVRREPIDETHGLGWRKSYVPFGTAPRPTRSGTIAPPVRILTIGKFHDRKNHFLLLDCFAALTARHEARLTIVGEAQGTEQMAYLARLCRRIRELGLRDRVRVEVNLAFENVQTLYMEHDLFVLPARDEPASVAVAEALASGLAVIASDSNGTSCYIRPRETGVVFRSDNRQSLSDALCWCVEDPKRLQMMGAAARAFAEREFWPDAIFRRLSLVLNIDEAVGERTP